MSWARSGGSKSDGSGSMTVVEQTQGTETSRAGSRSPMRAAGVTGSAQLRAPAGRVEQPVPMDAAARGSMYAEWDASAHNADRTALSGASPMRERVTTVEKIVPVEKIVYKEVPVPVDKVPGSAAVLMSL